MWVRAPFLWFFYLLYLQLSFNFWIVRYSFLEKRSCSTEFCQVSLQRLFRLPPNQVTFQHWSCESFKWAVMFHCSTKYGWLAIVQSFFVAPRFFHRYKRKSALKPFWEFYNPLAVEGELQLELVAPRFVSAMHLHITARELLYLDHEIIFASLHIKSSSENRFAVMCEWNC